MITLLDCIVLIAMTLAASIAWDELVNSTVLNGSIEKAAKVVALWGFGLDVIIREGFLGLLVVSGLFIIVVLIEELVIHLMKLNLKKKWIAVKLFRFLNHIIMIVVLLYIILVLG